MLRAIFYISIFYSMLFSLEITSKYDIHFGYFKKIATSTAKFEKNNKTYSINMDVESVGFAKFITNNRKESYSSKGFVKNGILYPLLYEKIKTTNSKFTKKRYSFDYKNSLITEEIIKSGFLTDKKTKKRLDYFVENDILSLFFNLPKLVINSTKDYSFKAVGAKSEGGSLEINSPTENNLESIKTLLDVDNGSFLRVVLNQKIFGSSKGELFINLDSDNICNKAILKDVIFFGDIVGEMTKKEKN